MAEWVAVMAVDPGGTTGVARGVFDVAQASVKRALARGRHMESFSMDLGADEMDVAVRLAEEWLDWSADAQVDGAQPALVMEDFVLRGFSTTDREGLYPVRIAAMVEGLLYRYQPKIVYQQPAEAMGFATNKRLKMWGLWVVGRDHERDAWRHVVSHLNGRIASV